MATTEKRITLALTKEDVRQIAELCLLFGESQTQIIKRALILLHHAKIKE
jgi:hypothetical protein